MGSGAAKSKGGPSDMTPDEQGVFYEAYQHHLVISRPHISNFGDQDVEEPFMDPDDEEYAYATHNSKGKAWDVSVRRVKNQWMLHINGETYKIQDNCPSSGRMQTSYT